MLECDQDRGGQPGAGGLAGDSDRGRGHAGVEQPPVGANSVLERGGMRMLGRQPVIDRHQPRSGAAREV